MIPVAVLGATGLVGQHLVRLLDVHPWFELAEVVASERRAGQRYGESVDWALSQELPEAAAAMRLTDLHDPVKSPVVLSALPAGAAAVVEPRLAAEGRLVCSNASAHRMEPSVPLIIPEVNGGHAVDDRPGFGDAAGGLITNPNCVVAGLALVLAVLNEAFGVESGTVVTLQALSGAGLAGPSALRAAGNVIPFIPTEEAKIEEEVGKLLGRSIPLAVAVNRVPVPDGHLGHVFLNLRRDADPGRVAEVLDGYVAPPWCEALPSVPERPLRVTQRIDGPQPALDIGWAQGMGVTVGRIRRVSGFEVALTFVVHNAVRGAAGACLANAELAYDKGWVDRSTHPLSVGVAPVAARASPVGTRA